MNPIEHTLNEATRRLRVMRWAQAVLSLGSMFCFASLIAGALVCFGWVSDRRWFLLLLFISTSALSAPFVGWLRRHWASSDDKARIAAALERSQPLLQDRLNAVCYLEEQPPATFRDSFICRIGKQAAAVLSPVVFWPRSHAFGTAMSLLLFLFLATSTAYLNHRFSPWQHLRPTGRLARINPRQHQLPPPPTNATPEQPTWGEVRITKPGGDVVAAPADTISLQVEAAASHPLTSLSVSISLNARTSTASPLSLTNQQLFAVVHTNVPLSSLNLSEGDVVSYFATAKTRQSSYTSDLYFIEIRAPQASPTNAPVSGPGQSKQHSTGDLSSLINQQQEVIRQTHRLTRSPSEENQGQKKAKMLSDTESDLASATRHLRGALDADAEPKPAAIDSLAKAADALTESAVALGTNALPLALEREQRALLDLVQARKQALGSAASSTDSVAKSDRGNQGTPEQTPAEQLDQITEFRNESAAARDFVEQTLEQQKALGEKAPKAPRSHSSEILADRQEQLRNSLKDFAERHPRPFSHSQQETRRAIESMGAAADALQKSEQSTSSQTFANKTAGQQTPEIAVTNAVHALENLNSSLRSQDAQRQLTDAYKLKHILDDLARSFDKFAAQQTNSNPNPQVSDTARQARQTVDQLKSLTDPQTDLFQQPLRNALSDTNVAPLRQTLSELEQSRELRQQQQLAGQARDGLGNISKAFDQSRPRTLQGGSDSPPEHSPGNSLDNALALLKQLLNQPSASGERSPQSRLHQQALQELQNGVQQSFGNTPDGQQALAFIQQLLRAPYSDADLIRLLQQVGRMKSARDLAEGPPLPEGFALDPSRLPPTYREQIQSYFQGLSEK